MVVSTVGASRLAAASRPIAATTAVTARATGSRADTTAPKATSRMPRVTGIDSMPSRLRPLSRSSPISLSPLASPPSAI
jgi:hypothetical protein